MPRPSSTSGAHSTCPRKANSWPQLAPTTSTLSRVLAAEARGCSSDSDRFRVDDDPTTFNLAQYHSLEEAGALASPGPFP